MIEKMEGGVEPQEKISESDRLLLELAKEKKQTALTEAKLAIANNEKAELHYKYVVMQMYMKYKLNENDGIREEDGAILKGNVK